MFPPEDCQESWCISHVRVLWISLINTTKKTYTNLEYPIILFYIYIYIYIYIHIYIYIL